ncbi:hypothetical protein MMJ63_28870, partial [Bacillus vallismortis]|nr:hypothetical protein [Bacillus vallismortis]
NQVDYQSCHGSKQMHTLIGLYIIGFSCSPLQPALSRLIHRKTAQFKWLIPILIILELYLKQSSSTS